MTRNIILPDYRGVRRIVWRVEDEQAIPEGLTYGMAFRGKGGRTAVPSIWDGDRQVAFIRKMTSGFREGQYKITIYSGKIVQVQKRFGQAYNLAEYAEAYVNDEERAVQFMIVAAAEAFRP